MNRAFRFLLVFGFVWCAAVAFAADWDVKSVSKQASDRPGDSASADAAGKFLHVQLDVTKAPNWSTFKVVNEQGEQIATPAGYNAKQNVVVFEGDWTNMMGRYLENGDVRVPLFQKEAPVDAAPEEVVTTPAPVAQPEYVPPVVNEPVVVDRPVVRDTYVERPVVRDRHVVRDRRVIYDDDDDVVVHYDHDGVAIYDDDDDVVVHDGDHDHYAHHGDGHGHGDGDGYAGGGDGDDDCDCADGDSDSALASSGSGSGGNGNGGSNGNSGRKASPWDIDPLGKSHGMGVTLAMGTAATGLSGSTAGYGLGSGSGSGSGSSSASTGAGSGSDDCDCADGNCKTGKGSGNGSGSGDGDDCGCKDGKGSGSGSGSGDGDDCGCKDGKGSGNGSGSGSGDGDDCGCKDGEGNGSGDGSGDGDGDGEPCDCEDDGDGPSPEENDSPKEKNASNAEKDGNGKNPGEGDGPKDGDQANADGEPCDCEGTGYGAGGLNPQMSNLVNLAPQYKQRVRNLAPQMKTPKVPTVYGPDMLVYNPQVPVWNPQIPQYKPGYGYGYGGGRGYGNGSGGGMYGPVNLEGAIAPPKELPPGMVLYISCGDDNSTGKVYQVDEQGRVLGMVNLPDTATGIALHREHGLVCACPRKGGKIYRINDGGKVEQILEGDGEKMIAPVDIAMDGNSDSMVIADNITDTLSLSNVQGKKPDTYRKFRGLENDTQRMSVAVGRDKAVLFGTDGDRGVYRFTGNAALSSSSTPVLPEPGGVAADPVSDRWAATQGSDEVVVMEGNEKVTSYKLPNNKSFYQKGMLSFAPPAGMREETDNSGVVVAMRDSDDAEDASPYLIEYKTGSDGQVERKLLFQWDRDRMVDFVVGPRMYWEQNERKTINSIY